jgi:hypothetical protein
VAIDLNAMRFSEPTLPAIHLPKILFFHAATIDPREDNGSERYARDAIASA